MNNCCRNNCENRQHNYNYKQFQESEYGCQYFFKKGFIIHSKTFTLIINTGKTY